MLREVIKDDPSPYVKYIEYIEEEMPATDERDEIVTFIRESGRGIIKRFTKGNNDDDLPI